MAVRLRWVGHRIRAEAAVVRAHAIATDAHHRLLHEIPCLVEAIVHISPAGPVGQEHHECNAHHVASR